jgi:hypothetical protein
MRRTGPRKRDTLLGVLPPEPVKAHLNLDDDVENESFSRAEKTPKRGVRHERP